MCSRHTAGVRAAGAGCAQLAAVLEARVNVVVPFKSERGFFGDCFVFERNAWFSSRCNFASVYGALISHTVYVKVDLGPGGRALVCAYAEMDMGYDCAFTLRSSGARVLVAE